MGVVIVIRDAKWDVIVALYKNEGDVSISLVVEIKALWWALKQCLETGLSDVTFEEDAKKVIDEVNNAEENWAPHGQLIEEIRYFSRGKKVKNLFTVLEKEMWQLTN